MAVHEVGKRDELVRKADHYREALICYSFALVRDRAIAEDVFQDSLLVILRKWNEYREGTSVYAWLRRIVRNKTMEALRARKRQEEPEDAQLLSEMCGLLDERLNNVGADLFLSTKKALRRCMAELNRVSIKIVLGFYWQNKTCAELASVHGRTPQAIRHFLVRTRRGLRICIKKRLEAAE